MENQAGEKKVRRRLNKRKLAANIFMFLLTVGVCVALALFAGDFLEKSAKPVTAESPQVTKNTQKTQPGKGSSNKGGPSKNGKSVVVDAGHGGFDSGATGKSGVREDELNLIVAKYLKAELEDNGMEVVMTRTDGNLLADTKDGDFEKRKQIIQGSGSDIVVSVHMNSFPQDTSCAGPIVIYMPGSVQGEKLAKAIQQCLNDSLDPKSPYEARSDNLYILRCGMQPSVLIECGFLSNREEEKKLQQEDYQRKIAKAVCEGIIAYFNAS